MEPEKNKEWQPRGRGQYGTRLAENQHDSPCVREIYSRVKGHKKLCRCRPFHERIVFVSSQKFTTGRKTKLLHRKLGQTYLRSRDLADCKRLQDGVHTTASADITPMGTPALSFRDETNRKRDKRLRVKGGCLPGSSCSRPVHKQFVSSQKERRQNQPVINLKQLNGFVEYQHFKMEDISVLKDLLRPND